MKSISTPDQCIPKLPVAVESSTRSAQSLAAKLYSDRPDLRRTTMGRFLNQQQTQTKLAKITQDCANLCRTNIESHLQQYRELFEELQTWLLMQGRLLDAATTAVLKPDDQALQMEAAKLSQSEMRIKVRIQILVAKLGIRIASETDSELEPLAVYIACEAQLKALQASWKEQHANHLDMTLQSHSNELLSIGANLLVRLAEAAMAEVLITDGCIDNEQESVMVDLQNSLLWPFSDQWPRSIDCAKANSPVNSVHSAKPGASA